tara:strand:+ start:2968 stop:3750 length:783 start_codon:yes stop_codon:yes gene_type:complete
MKIVLFDMDGTLTLPRQKMGMMIASALGKLQREGFSVGIVTGSDMKYVEEQCDIMFDFSPVNYRTVHYFPCNGTKYYTYEPAQTELHNVSMQDCVGKEKYNQIIYKLAENQFRMKHTLYGKEIPLTGNFIDCRGSMINWCPIGRNASKEERNAWSDLDSKHSIRKILLDAYFKDPIYEEVEVKLGGSTSFDIFPRGWDKTYVMRHLKDYESIYFIGDKCVDHGNDKELYELLQKRNNCRGYITDGPKTTISLIDQILEGK